jgi:hypothetical protein
MFHPRWSNILRDSGDYLNAKIKAADDKGGA